MGVKVPVTERDFLREIGRLSLTADWAELSNDGLPKFLSTNPVLDRAGVDWRKAHDHELGLLANAASRALQVLPRSLGRAQRSFLHDMTVFKMKPFFETYLKSFVDAAGKSQKKFAQLMNIFCELGR